MYFNIFNSPFPTNVLLKRKSHAIKHQANEWLGMLPKYYQTSEHHSL